MKIIPVNIITGFTGAGKTTAILGLLRRRPPHERWAVLINDFGQTRIDPESFRDGAGVVIREVPGGCPCCSAQVQVRVALTRLLREVQPQRLLIEPSSLGHLAAFLHLLRDPLLAQTLSLRATLCMVDPQQFSEPIFFESSNYQEQLNVADVIIANQTDDVTPQQMDAFMVFANHMQPAKLCVAQARNGQLDLAWLDWKPRVLPNLERN